MHKWGNFGLYWRGWKTVGSAPIKKRFTVSRSGEAGVLLCRSRGQKGNPLKTYKWVSLQSAAPIDKLTDEQIKAALDVALARKGLTNANSDSTADL
jgi:hypothetical protein